MGKISFAIKILIIVLVAYLVVSSWGEVVTKSFIEYFDLNKDDISTWVIIGTLALIILFVVIILSGIEIHDLFGISETVDVELTGTKEKFVNGKVKHYNSRTK
jgi:hypothetical protein